MDTLIHIESPLVRQAALPGYLARKVLAMLQAPKEGTRAHLVETCRADLDWADADYRRLRPDLDHFKCSTSAAHRLPHEKIAARVVNAHLHMVGLEAPMRSALQRKDRASAEWYRPQLKRALEAYRKAGREYRVTRMEGK